MFTINGIVAARVSVEYRKNGKPFIKSNHTLPKCHVCGHASTKECAIDWIEDHQDYLCPVCCETQEAELYFLPQKPKVHYVINSDENYRAIEDCPAYLIISNKLGTYDSFYQGLQFSVAKVIQHSDFSTEVALGNLTQDISAALIRHKSNLVVNEAVSSASDFQVDRWTPKDK